MVYFNPEIKSKKAPLDISSNKCQINRDTISKMSDRINIDRDTLTCYDSWYQLDDGLYYFKREFAFTELLMSELYNAFKIKSVELLIADNGFNTGVLSKNFRMKNKSYSCIDDFMNGKLSSNGIKTVDDMRNSYSKVESLLRKILSSKNCDEILAYLSRMIALDFFCGQCDRYGRNLTVEEDKKTSKVIVSPLTDNGYSFDNNPYSYYGFFQDMYFPTPDEKYEDISKKEVFLTLRFVLTNKAFRDALVETLDIDMLGVLKRVKEKYSLTFETKDVDEVISYTDKKKRIISNALEVSRKLHR